MSARLAAGELDRRIRILPQSETQDAAGEPIATDGPGMDLWAKRIDQRIGEVFSAASDQVGARIVFRIRWRDDIETTALVVYPARDDGDRYEIKSIQEHGRRVGLDLVCERLGANV